MRSDHGQLDETVASPESLSQNEALKSGIRYSADFTGFYRVYFSFLLVSAAEAPHLLCMHRYTSASQSLLPFEQPKRHATLLFSCDM